MSPIIPRHAGWRYNQLICAHPLPGDSSVISPAHLDPSNRSVYPRAFSSMEYTEMQLVHPISSKMHSAVSSKPDSVSVAHRATVLCTFSSRERSILPPYI